MLLAFLYWGYNSVIDVLVGRLRSYLTEDLMRCWICSIGLYENCMISLLSIRYTRKQPLGAGTVASHAARIHALQVH